MLTERLDNGAVGSPAMSNPEAPIAAIDWESAEVHGSELTLPLRGRLTAAAVALLTDLVRDLPPTPGGQTITVSPVDITVAPIRRGTASDIHELLQRLMDETNAVFARRHEAAATARRGHRARAQFLVASLLLCVLVGVALALEWVDSEVLRVIVAVTFVLMVPAWAIVRPWDRVRGRAWRWLAIALSLILAGAAALVTVRADAWSPDGLLTALASLIVVSAIAALWRDSRQAARRTGSGSLSVPLP
jgi:hypothetical protein